MAYESIDSADIEAGKPVDNDLMTQIKNNEDANNAATAGAINYDIPNGDMELTDASFPANWTPTTYPGGTAGLETTSPLNGTQSMKFTHPGGASNGGGYADSDYLPCGENAPFRVSWLHSATAAGMKNQVYIRWFDEDKVFISATTIYESISNPTTETQFSNVANPVSTARFWRARVVGGFTDTDVAGNALFDAFTFERIRIRVYDISADSTIEILDIRDCKKLRITLLDLVGSNAFTQFIRVSADNGTTWVSSGIYSPGIADDASTTSLTSTNIIVTTGSVTATTHISGEFVFENLGAANYTTVYKNTRYFDTGGTPTFYTEKKHFLINSTTSYNAIQIYSAAGTITAKIVAEELF